MGPAEAGMSGCSLRFEPTPRRFARTSHDFSQFHSDGAGIGGPTPLVREPGCLLAENRVIRDGHRRVALAYSIRGANRFGPLLLPRDGQVPLEDFRIDVL